MEARITEISLAEALRYLGVRGTPDARLQEDLSRCAALLLSTARPRFCWRLFARSADGGLKGTAFHPQGQAILRHLSGCQQVICLAATLGVETEALLRQAQAQNMADAVLLDALASAAIENVCDNLSADLADSLVPQRLTPRFSPGYGDFPLSQQRELCAVLNVQRLIGITLTPGGLMIPQKSVTALIGVLPEPLEKDASRFSPDARSPASSSAAISKAFCASEIKEEHACGRCSLKKHCTYAKEGLSCEKS